MSVELSKTKELSRPDVMFGIKKRSLSIKDFYVGIVSAIFAALWILAAVIMSHHFPIIWSQAQGAMVGGGVGVVLMTLWMLGSATDEPLYEQRRDADQKYRVWLQQELKPYVESKHSVKLTGDFFTGKLMAEKDENLFEVKLFGVQHIPSYVNTENNARMWSHPVITGEVGLKRVDRPGAVSYSKI